jgi:hypothetical protein
MDLHTAPTHPSSASTTRVIRIAGSNMRRSVSARVACSVSGRAGDNPALLTTRSSPLINKPTR